jgi:hypothetical protein
MTIYTRRRILNSGLATIAALTLPNPPVGAAVLPPVSAYRNPGCECCGKWAEQMKQAGFTITMEDDPNLEARRTQLGVPSDLAGCHTALMGEYVLEGHVPPTDILRFIEAESKARGLAVRGMPSGSPGMDTNGAAEKFDTMIFYKDGTSSVYAGH